MSKKDEFNKKILELFPEAKNITKVNAGANGDPFSFEADGKTLLIKFIKPHKREINLTGNEITALKAVTSDYVVNLINKGNTKVCDEERSYLVFPYIEGSDLEDLRADAPLDNETLLKIATDMAKGISDMWEVGIIHRDLKPRNVRIDSNKHITIIDLGIARFRDDPKKGKGKGSYKYASPEQNISLSGAQGYVPHIDMTISFASDLWSLGVMLYELATGKYPFDETENVMESIAGDPIEDPRLINPNLDVNISEVIKRLLEKQPCKRYRSPQELVTELEDEGRVANPKRDIMFYFHQGHSSSGGFSYFMDYISEGQTIPNGVIFSARYMPSDKNVTKKLKTKGLEIIVDPETHILASRTEGWTEGVKKLPYFQPITPEFFIVPEAVDDWINRVVDFQLEHDADVIIAPYFFMFNNKKWTLANTELIKRTKSILKERNIEKPLFAALALGNEVVKDHPTLRQILDVFFYVPGIEGFYVLAAEERSGSKLSVDADYLRGLKELISTLSYSYKVILGRADLNALLLLGQNLYGFSSNPYESLRKFNFSEDKDPSGWPQRVSKIFVFDLLNFVKMEEFTENIEPLGLGIGKCGCEYCKDRNKSYATYKHFVLRISDYVRELSPLSISERKKRGQADLETAKNNFEVLKKNHVIEVLHQQSKPDFIPVWEQVFVDED